jgi:hypothetical protein
VLDDLGNVIGDYFAVCDRLEKWVDLKAVQDL